MQKNLQTVRSSQGWADEQVGLQYETIGRQLKALNADFQQLIVTLDQSGASAGISDFIQMARELVQILASIKPENIQMLVNTAIKLSEIAVGLKMISTLSKIRIGLTEIIPILRTLPSLLSATRAGITSVSTAIGLLSRMTGWIGVIILGAQAIYTLYEAVSDFNNKANFENIKTKTKELGNSFNGLVEEAKSLGSGGVDNINKYIDSMKSATDVIDSATSSQQEKDEANKTLQESEKALTDLIGADAVERVKASGYSKEAIDKEITTYRQMQIVSNAMLQQRIKDEIATTDNTIRNVESRIQAYQKEMEYYSKIAQIKFQTYRTNYENYEKNWANKESSIAKRAAERDLINSQKEWEEVKTKAADIVFMQGENRKTLSELSKIRSNYSNAAKGKFDEPQNTNKDISGGYGGIVGVDSGESGNFKDNKGSNGNSNKNYAEEHQRNELVTKRNQLWYEGTIQAKQYENSLKEITNDEQYYGTTVDSIIAKGSLYSERSKQLDDYEAKLKAFRTELEQELEQKMKANPQLMSQAKYTVGLKGEELTKNIEVNKELYQQEKTVSSIVNMISSVNQKLEENKSKQIDITNEIRKQSDEISKQKISDIEQQSNIDIAKVNRPTNFDYSKQKNQIELEAERAKLEQYKNDLAKTMADIDEQQNSANAKTMADLYKRKQTEIQLVEETNAKIAQLEYEKNSTIRQGLYDVTQQFLIQGNSLRDIWNDLWKDLAREALQRLFQIQAQASILGSLFGWSTGSKTSTVSASSYNFGNPISYGDLHLHTGGNITGFKKMHTGGMVEQGRLGVVPKLKSDEVVRTLQVGEEVNSVSDRRSNEILATVAMKAIDSRNQQPNNINIMAIDSKSFAEYLNDNADILLAVLNKQGALGRR